MTAIWPDRRDVNRLIEAVVQAGRWSRAWKKLSSNLWYLAEMKSRFLLEGVRLAEIDKARIAELEEALRRVLVFVDFDIHPTKCGCADCRSRKVLEKT